MSGDCGHPQIKRIGYAAAERCGMCGLPIGAYDGRPMVEGDLGPLSGGDGALGMTDTREALARLIAPELEGPLFGRVALRQFAEECADRILAAGYTLRPSEPQAAPVEAEVLERARRFLAEIEAGGGYALPTRDEYAEDCRALLAEHARAEAAEQLASVFANKVTEQTTKHAHELRRVRSRAEAAEATVARQREALEAARDTFRRYTQMHLGKGAIDKAQANKAMVDMIDAALSAPAAPPDPAAAARLKEIRARLTMGRYNYQTGADIAFLLSLTEDRR